MRRQHASPKDPLSQFRLDGCVAFLSGATGLLGRSMSSALAVAGAHVILNARTQENLELLVTELSRDTNHVSIACFDVTDENAISNLVSEVGSKYGRLDILINNASSGRACTLDQATIEDFQQSYRINVTAAFQLLQSLLPLLKESGKHRPGGASVINIGSMYGGVSPDPSIYGASGANNPPFYGAAKAGLLQLTRYAACHLAPDHIRVNCISPGPFPADRYLKNDPEFSHRLSAKVPMRRTGDPNELQGPLLFLASDASSYVTGINLAVDGGWTAW